MGTIIAILAILIGGVMLAVVLSGSGSRQLQQRFIEMGELQGKTLDEILIKVGQPNLMTAAQDGKIYQWKRPKYRIALLFDKNNICKGVTHEMTA